MIAYPGAQAVPESIQAGYGALCFAWGRRYLKTGTTAVAAASTAPFWQNTKAMNGGPCNQTGQACYSITATGSKRYDLPSTIVAHVRRPRAWAVADDPGLRPGHRAQPGLLDQPDPLGLHGH